MDPFVIPAEVTATASVITQDDPRHPHYTEETLEEQDNDNA